MENQPKTPQKLETELSALRQQVAELKAHNQDLQAFVQTVAHDLRNPLALINGLGDTLEESFGTLSDEEMRHYLRIIARNGHRMNSIIREQLILASMHKQDIELEPLDMAHLVIEAQQTLSLLIAEHQAEIDLPASWPLASGNAEWIAEVWVSYLGNAIKSGGEPPRVELGGERQEDGMVRFWVRDNGSGLTPEAQANMFKSPEHLPKNRTQGYGLGLPVTQRIVERLGGRVGVESKGVPGQKSVLFFTLPAID